MFGSNLLDVAIGLIFVFLVFSLLVTVINEWIATLAKMRASELERAISRMIHTNNFTGLFYSHPFIKALAKKDTAKPSYIEAKTFAKVVTDLLQTEGTASKPGSAKTAFSLSQAIINFGSPGQQKGTAAAPGGKDLELLLSFAKEANDSVEEFKKKLETWFNETMSRVSGWYQRKIKYITFGVGLAVTIIFNIDSIEVYTTLSTNNKVREEMIVVASNYLNKTTAQTSDTDSAAVRLQRLIADQVDPTMNILGIGWTKGSLEKNLKCIKWETAVFGWILTVFALSLGAPFWFDLLSKAMKLRGTGAPADKTDKKSP